MEKEMEKEIEKEIEENKERYEDIIEDIKEMSGEVKEIQNRFSIINKRIMDKLKESKIDKIILRGGELSMKKQITKSNILKKDIEEIISKYNLNGKDIVERIWKNRVYKETESLKYFNK
jgi:predicted metalloenzyme YecM